MFKSSQVCRGFHRVYGVGGWAGVGSCFVCCDDICLRVALVGYGLFLFFRFRTCPSGHRVLYPAFFISPSGVVQEKESRGGIVSYVCTDHVRVI